MNIDTEGNTNDIRDPFADSPPIRDAYDIGSKEVDIDARHTFLQHPDDSSVVVPIQLVTVAGGASRIDVMADALRALDERMGGPRRRTGTLVMTDQDSFVRACLRLGDIDDSVIFADTDKLGFTAVLNDHQPSDGDGSPGENGWRDHRIVYRCPRSPEWAAWSAREGVAMSQVEFGDWIDERLEDLTASDGGPSPLEVLAVARKLSIKTKGVVHREVDVTTGAYHMIDKSEHDTGSTVIPRAFAISIPVFDGGAHYQVEVRIRFAVNDGKPQFAFAMYRRKETERDAFDAVREFVGDQTKFPVWNGQP